MRKILCIVLVLLMLFSTVLYAENMEDLKNKSEEIKNQIDEANKEIEEVQEELSKNLQELQNLDEKIKTMESELNGLNEEIEALNKDIEEKQKNLKEAEKKYKIQKQLLEERLVILYEEGEIQYLDVLFNSSSMSEFISNYYLITEVISYDTELLESVEEQKNNIENTKTVLSKQKEELVIKSKNQQKTAKVLSNTKAVRENYISKLSEEEREIQAKIDEYHQRFEEIEAEIAILAEQELSIGEGYIGGVMAWPVPGYTRITSKYGMRTHPITGVYKLHTGVDVGAPMGANFIAAETGVVTKAGYNSAYGNMVIINHGGGVQTLYAHGSEIMVEVGQLVAKGDIILKVGSTGYSTGPHAHFEVRLNGSVVNPMPYITTNYVDAENKELNENTTNVTNNTIF